MKKLIATLAVLVSFALPATFAQQSAGQDVKDAGSQTKGAAKSTGRATKKTAKKGARKVKHGAHKGAHKTKQGAQSVEDKTTSR